MSEIKQDLTVDNAIKLYEIFCNNSKDAVNLHTKHAQGFLTLIIAVIAATIAGLTQSHNIPYPSILVIGPVVNMCVCVMAIFFCNRPYRKFLECISVMANLEDYIGLTSSSSKDLFFCKDLSFIPERWIKNRDKYEKSSTFVDKEIYSGANIRIISIFISLFVVNLAFGIFIIST